MISTFIYTRDGKDYPVTLITKRMRSTRYRYRDGGIIITAPLLTSKNSVIKGLDKFFYRLTKENPFCSGQGEDYIYLLGKKYQASDSGYIPFNDGSKLTYKDRTELEKKLKKWFLKYITSRHRYYERIMKTYINTVRVRKMNTRYGSNSIGKKSITYSTILMHYSSDVIDSVIIHELAHCFVSNHGDNFYKIVYKYCPNYDYLHNRLKKGVYSND